MILSCRSESACQQSLSTPSRPGGRPTGLRYTLSSFIFKIQAIQLPGMSAPRLVSDEQKETQKQLDTTCWLYYCGCFGVGKAISCGDPYCQGKSKFCCIAQEIKTTNFYNDTEGLCAGTNKICCLLSNCIVPAPQPFIELCGYRCCGPAKPNAKVSGGGFGYSESLEVCDPTVETLQSQLKESLSREDYDEALKLVELLKSKQTEAKGKQLQYSALPAAHVMTEF